MLIVDSLKKLYAALGGNTASVADIDLNAEMIDKIADVAGGGSGDSPKVKVFYMRYDEENYGTETLFTYNDIAPYINDGYVIFVVQTNNNLPFVITFASASENNSYIEISSVGTETRYRMEANGLDEHYFHYFD